MNYIIIIKLFILSIASLPLLGYGQENSLQTVQSPGIDVQVDYGIGYLKNKNSSLNTVLQNNGLAKVNEGLLTISAAVKVFHNRFLYGVQWMGFKSSKNEGNLKTSIGCFSIEPLLGYSIIKTNQYKLSPYIGFNFSNSNLNLKELIPVSTFSSVLATGNKETTIEFNNYVLDLGIQGERIVDIKNNRWDCSQNSRYMTIGLKAGYLLNLSKSNNGRYNNQRIADSPTYHLNGYYGSITIGIGKRFRPLK